MNVSSQFESQYFYQVVKYPQWRDAMKLELDAMELNHTWSIVPLTRGKHAVGYRWIYKIKYNSNGTVDRYKARLVVKLYTIGGPQLL